MHTVFLRPVGAKHTSARKNSGVKRNARGTSVINASADFHSSEYFVPEASIATYFFRKYVQYSFSSLLFPLILIFFVNIILRATYSNFKYSVRVLLRFVIYINLIILIFIKIACFMFHEEIRNQFKLL